MPSPRNLAFAALTACLLSTFTAQAAGPKETSAVSQSDAAAVVDINTATVAELVKLPSVGKSRAQAIVELRTRLGGFESIEQLMRVRGIGRKTFRKMRPMLTVGHSKGAKKAKKARK